MQREALRPTLARSAQVRRLMPARSVQREARRVAFARRASTPRSARGVGAGGGSAKRERWGQSLCAKGPRSAQVRRARPVLPRSARASVDGQCPRRVEVQNNYMPSGCGRRAARSAQAPKTERFAESKFRGVYTPSACVRRAASIGALRGVYTSSPCVGRAGSIRLTPPLALRAA